MKKSSEISANNQHVWRRRWPVSIGFGVVMGLIALFSAWVGAANGYAMHGPPVFTLLRMKDLSLQLQADVKHDRAAVANLEDLLDQSARESLAGTADLQPVRRRDLLDGWQHLFVYEHAGQTFRLTSLGADGRPSGVGIDADFSIDQTLAAPRQGRLTLWQFLFVVPKRGILWWCAIGTVFGTLLCTAVVRTAPVSRGGVTTVMAQAVSILAAAAVITCIIGELDIVKYH